MNLIGFPLHLWTDTNLKNIGRRIGHIDTIELTEGHMLINVDSRKPLKFSRKVEYKGDEVTIEIKYDMLLKHCATCGMLSHEKAYCQLEISDQGFKFLLNDQVPYCGCKASKYRPIICTQTGTVGEK